MLRSQSCRSGRFAGPLPACAGHAGRSGGRFRRAVFGTHLVLHLPNRVRRRGQGRSAQKPPTKESPSFSLGTSRVWHGALDDATTPGVPAYRLSVDQRPQDHGAIEADPPHAWQIDILVALLYAVPEPQERGEQVGAPRGNRNAGGFVAQPDREDL